MGVQDPDFMPEEPEVDRPKLAETKHIENFGKIAFLAVAAVVAGLLLRETIINIGANAGSKLAIEPPQATQGETIKDREFITHWVEFEGGRLPVSIYEGSNQACIIYFSGRGVRHDNTYLQEVLDLAKKYNITLIASSMPNTSTDYVAGDGLMTFGLGETDVQYVNALLNLVKDCQQLIIGTGSYSSAAVPNALVQALNFEEIKDKLFALFMEAPLLNLEAANEARLKLLLPEIVHRVFEFLGMNQEIISRGTEQAIKRAGVDYNAINPNGIAVLPAQNLVIFANPAGDVVVGEPPDLTNVNTYADRHPQSLVQIVLPNNQVVPNVHPATIDKVFRQEQFLPEIERLIQQALGLIEN